MCRLLGPLIFGEHEYVCNKGREAAIPVVARLTLVRTSCDTQKSKSAAIKLNQRQTCELHRAEMAIGKGQMINPKARKLLDSNLYMF